jgi:hypothetical protein
MRLKSDFIPHEKFHKGIWLSCKIVPWYFFLETNRNYKIPDNKSFYNTIDENLLPIVKKLHKNNIPTTPSCSGHFEDKEYYSDVFYLLDKFQNDVKEKHIILKDDETNKKYKYKNPKFELPWKKEEFLKKINDYQKKGVLGFIDKNDIFYNQLMGKDYKKIKDGDVTIIIVESETPKESSEKWNIVKNDINNIIQK